MRRTQKLNESWQFTGPEGKKEPVSIPHTWNAIDGQDGGNDYKRCLCTYEKEFIKPDFTADERVYLQFHGVNSECEVLLNGEAVCTHEGGYSTFRKDITELLQQKNALTVKVTNAPNDRVYPQKADFTFYGGIYRDVELIIVKDLHFDLDNYGGLGIRVTAKPVEGYTRSEVMVETWRNTYLGEVQIRLLDAAGAIVAQGSGERCRLMIPDVHLWNGIESPYLYTAVATLTVEGEAMDEISARFGVRDFHYHAKTGFYLNGRSYPLRGVSRHQDRKGLGNAITKKEHLEDMDLICEMGANTIRLAHYQHDQYFYDLCDLRAYAERPAEHDLPDEGTDYPELQSCFHRLLGREQRDHNIHQRQGRHAGQPQSPQ